jgi:hypothetical protein
LVTVLEVDSRLLVMRDSSGIETKRKSQEFVSTEKGFLVKHRLVVPLLGRVVALFFVRWFFSRGAEKGSSKI